MCHVYYIVITVAAGALAMLGFTTRRVNFEIYYRMVEEGIILKTGGIDNFKQNE